MNSHFQSEFISMLKARRSYLDYLNDVSNPSSGDEGVVELMEVVFVLVDLLEGNKLITYVPFIINHRNFLFHLFMLPCWGFVTLVCKSCLKHKKRRIILIDP